MVNDDLRRTIITASQMIESKEGQITIYEHQESNRDAIDRDFAKSSKNETQSAESRV